LAAVAVDDLAKIAVLVKQSDADHGNSEIAGRLQLITSHVSEPARIDRKRLTQHEFHAEIRDASQRRLRELLLKPGWLCFRLALGLHQAFQ
jgi:hypothetical protein